MPSIGDGLNRMVLVHAFAVEAGEVKEGADRFIAENPKEMSRTYKEIVEQCSTEQGCIGEKVDNLLHFMWKITFDCFFFFRFASSTTTGDPRRGPRRSLST